MDKIINTYNALVGAIVTFLSTILGKHWALFMFFLILNILDWITGLIKSHINHQTNSVTGLKGIIKKLSYWLIIAFAFGTSVILMEIGNALNINLRVTTLLGWYVLASLIINELRSIFENLIEAGFNIPTILVKGLQIADKAVNQESITKTSEEKE